MLSDDLLQLAACVQDASHIAQSPDGYRRFLNTLSINLQAASDRAAAMEACFQQDIDDAAATAPNVLPFPVLRAGGRR